jgi:hypothetical protein
LKRIILVLMVIGIILIVSASTVFAGGDQVTGGTGNGKGSQESHEVGCENQPCVSAAPQPENQFRTGFD